MTQTVPAFSPRIMVLEPTALKIHSSPQLALENLGKSQTLGRDQLLYRAGDTAGAVYLVLEGMLKLNRYSSFGEERLVGLAGPGDVLGLDSLSQQGFHGEDASSLSAVKVLRLDANRIEALMRQHPPISQLLLGAMSNRAQELLELLELSHAPVSVKVTRALLWLAHRFGHKEAGGWYRLDLGLRQEELASLVGVQRPTLTHTLTGLRDGGLLRGTRGVYWLNLLGLERHLEGLDQAA